MIKAVYAAIRGADRRAWQLAVAETLAWAGLYYLFPVLLLHWERDQGWSRGQLSVALTMAFVVAALGAPMSGRLIDRGYGRQVLISSAVLGGLALATLAFIDTLTAFFVVWFVIGVAMAGCLYEPCFAFVTHTRRDGAQRVITLITLAAGFASTIAFPIAGAVADGWGWRASAGLFAALILGVAVPLFWFGTAAEAVDAPQVHHHRSEQAASASPWSRRAFWFLAGAFSTTGLAHGMLISHLLPLLDERGATPELALLTASLIGPMQVAGRVALMSFDHRVSVFFVTGLSFVFMITATSILYVTGAAMAGLLLFAILQGTGFGVTSITKPVVTVRIMGRANFGAISGAMAVPYMMSYAFAPSVAAQVWQLGGYDAVLLLAIFLPIIGFFAFYAARLGHR